MSESERPTRKIMVQKADFYAASSHDRPMLRRFIAKRMKARTVELTDSHVSMISQPGALAKMIQR